MTNGTEGRRSTTGLHTRTQPMRRIGNRFNAALAEVGSSFKTTVLPTDTTEKWTTALPSPIRYNPWPRRYREAFKWFGLVLLYLGLSFIILAIALVGTKGLILIWEAWLSGI